MNVSFTNDQMNFKKYSYEVTSGPDAGVKRRNIFKELVLALGAAVFLGFGTLFLLLWSGVYV